MYSDLSCELVHKFIEAWPMRMSKGAGRNGRPSSAHHAYPFVDYLLIISGCCLGEWLCSIIVVI